MLVTTKPWHCSRAGISRHPASCHFGEESRTKFSIYVHLAVTAQFTPEQHFSMAPIALETEDHLRDAQFNKAMHGMTAKAKAGFSSMLNKDPIAHKAASDEYWKHWDNQSASTETAAIREVITLLHTLASLAADLGSGTQSRICFSDKTLLQSRH